MSTPKNNHQTAISWTELKDSIETIYELKHELLSRCVKGPEDEA